MLNFHLQYVCDLLMHILAIHKNDVSSDNVINILFMYIYILPNNMLILRI